MFEDSWINGKCTVKDELTVLFLFFFQEQLQLSQKLYQGVVTLMEPYHMSVAMEDTDK